MGWMSDETGLDKCTANHVALTPLSHLARAAKVFVSDCEGFVYQHAARVQAVDQDRKKWPVQVIRHDDAIEQAAGQRPGCAVLQVCSDSFDTPTGYQARYISVDGRYLVSRGREHVRMTTCAAGDIKDGPAGRYQRGTAFNPGRWGRKRGCGCHEF